MSTHMSKPMLKHTCIRISAHMCICLSVHIFYTRAKVRHELHRIVVTQNVAHMCIDMCIDMCSDMCMDMQWVCAAYHG